MNNEVNKKNLLLADMSAMLLPPPPTPGHLS